MLFHEWYQIYNNWISPIPRVVPVFLKPLLYDVRVLKQSDGMIIMTIIAFQANGYELQPMNNLKELYFDNCCFWFDHDLQIREDEDYPNDDDEDNSVTAFEAMSDNNNYQHIFLYYRLCNNPLERISIRKARYNTDFNNNKQILPQSILMKFVRKAPATLVWFRSDLSATNIRILQSERPEIQFLN